jgi:hypothetical protein
MSMPSSEVVKLPPGVSISPGRETSQLGPNNQNVPGLAFTLTLTNGTTSTVFVPYALMRNLPAVSQLFADRVEAINGVTTLGT